MAGDGPHVLTVSAWNAALKIADRPGHGIPDGSAKTNKRDQENRRIPICDERKEKLVWKPPSLNNLM